MTIGMYCLSFIGCLEVVFHVKRLVGAEWFHVKHLPPIFMVGYGVGFYCDD